MTSKNKVLICEMCGSSLDVTKAISDVITCEYCDSATNIHGFIHLNMSSDQRAAALMKRGLVLIEYKVWDKAKYVLEKAVEYDDDNAKAYLGLLLVDARASKEEELSLHGEPLSNYVNYHKALQFADSDLKKRLELYAEESLQLKQQRQLALIERQKRQEERKRELELQTQARIEKERRKRIKQVTIIAAIMIPLIVVIVISSSHRSRSNALTREHLSNFTDLTTVVELAALPAAERVIDTRGMTPLTDGSTVVYVVELRNIEAAGFHVVAFHSFGMEFEQVTKFGGVDLIELRQVIRDLSDKYNLDIEIVFHERERIPGRGFGLREQLDLEDDLDRKIYDIATINPRSPIVADIRFVKNDIPVIIRSVRSDIRADIFFPESQKEEWIVFVGNWNEWYEVDEEY